MHGLDAHLGALHPPEVAAAGHVDADHPHDGSTPTEDGHCADCAAGHMMAACVAIITAIGGFGLVRRFLTRGSLTAPATAMVSQVRALVELAHPPDPVWIRLSVMRC
jgi:hypothetical protein